MKVIIVLILLLGKKLKFEKQIQKSQTEYRGAVDTLSMITSVRSLTGKYDGCLFTCKVDAVGMKCDFVKI